MAVTRLRIAGGTARGVPLTEPKGMRLRPTSALVREAIFNILENVEGASVLDLFAGTGALGIEALSRGAERATFIEGEAAACQAIHQSLARAGFGGQATVVRGRLPGALSTVAGPFELILMDPPYQLSEIEPVIEAAVRLLADGGTLVYEHGSRYNPPGQPGGLKLLDRRTYGDSAIALYARQERE